MTTTFASTLEGKLTPGNQIQNDIQYYVNQGLQIDSTVIYKTFLEQYHLFTNTYVNFTNAIGGFSSTLDNVTLSNVIDLVQTTITDLSKNYSQSVLDAQVKVMGFQLLSKYLSPMDATALIAAINTKPTLISCWNDAKPTIDNVFVNGTRDIAALGMISSLNPTAEIARQQIIATILDAQATLKNCNANAVCIKTWVVFFYFN